MWNPFKRKRKRVDIFCGGRRSAIGYRELLLKSCKNADVTITDSRPTLKGSTYRVEFIDEASGFDATKINKEKG